MSEVSEMQTRPVSTQAPERQRDAMVRWTRWVLAHRRLVVLLWVALAVAGGATASLTTSRLGKTFDLPGRPSFETGARVAALYRGEGGGQDPTVPVITAPAGRALAGAAGRALLRRAEAAASDHGRYRVLGYGTTGSARFLTAGGRSAFMLVFTGQAGFGSPDPTPAVTAAVRAALPAGFTERTTGIDQLQSSTGQKGGNGVFVETLLGGLGALVVLAIVFASALAVLPLIMAIVAIPTTFLLLLGLTELTTVNFVVQFLIGLVGLGVAIDYSLLVTTRWREETAQRSTDEAVVLAMATAGRAVAASGVTVAIGLLSLVLLPVPFLHSMGWGGVLIPLVSVAVALTLLPVCLASLGPRLDRHRLRRRDSASPPWFWWARLVDRAHWPAAIAGLAILGALVAPVFSLNIGSPVTTSLARSGEPHEGLQTLRSAGTPTGALDPIVVLVGAPGDARRVAARLDRVPGVWAALPPSGPADARGGTALVTVLPRPETGAPGGTAVIARVRAAVRGDRAVLGVTGSGPESVDFNHAIYDSFPLLLALVALVTFLVLARAFRSLLLAAKAVVLNLVSLGAAYGVLVLVWQDGHGSRALFGLPATGAITFWVPIVVFAFLFGLAIDYEVFILSRMREAYDETGNTSTAVVEGIGRTGRLVTSAALILTLAFVAMSTAPLSFLKMLATGLAAGILIDAFLVRALLVPALVSLFGRWNWVLPGPAARLLRVPTPAPPRPQPPFA
jgi:RND superfamily putative drug exporter